MTGTTRRHFLAATSAALFASPFIPKAWAAGSRDPRLLVVILRGGLDGLGAVMPIGDPDFAALRADFQSPKLGEAHRLDAMFALNPSMPALASLYDRKEALIFHAVATPYRARSHFDGQEVLENGMPKSGTGEDSGWLNRALAAMQPEKGVRLAPKRGLAVAATTPLILRGAAPVESWQPQAMNYAHADTLQRLEALYDARDLKLAAALREGARVDLFLGDEPSMKRLQQEAPASSKGFALAANAAARLMAAPDGPRIAVMNFDGWDTHTAEGPYDGRLAKNLVALDEGVTALRTGMGPVWADTSVLIVTEFGRTARVNGTKGTDHGNGGVAFLVGGRVNGGRVIADWPGLNQKALFEDRDLAPTTDMRAVLKGLLADQLDIDEKTLGSTIFPGSKQVRPMQGLIRA